MNGMVKGALAAVLFAGFAAFGMTDAERYEQFMRKTGGTVEIPGKGWLAVANGQAKASEAEVRYCVKWLGKLLNVQCRYVGKDTPFDVKSAAAERKASGANAMLFFADDKDLPMSLVAPEANWAMVNVAPFDASVEPVFTNRFEKEVARAAALLFGAAVSANPISVMKPVFGEKDLDALKGETWMEDAVPGFRTKVPAMGMTFNDFTTYKQTCFDGTALPPTNDYQRAIWEGVRSGELKPRKRQTEEGK